jgi:hypothetical protein
MPPVIQEYLETIQSAIATVAAGFSLLRSMKGEKDPSEPEILAPQAKQILEARRENEPQASLSASVERLVKSHQMQLDKITEEMTKASANPRATRIDIEIELRRLAQVGLQQIELSSVLLQEQGVEVKFLKEYFNNTLKLL